MSEQQAATPELRRWILEQAAAGRTPEDVFKAMEASGWEGAVAAAALRETLPEKALPANASWGPRPVPEPQPDPAQWLLSAGDREVRVIASMRAPRIVVLGNLLSADECDELMALASSRLTRSETVQTTTGSSEVNAARTSDGMFFLRGEHAVCARLEARIARLLHWPVENGEGLQVLRYAPGAEYRPHYDYFDPAEPGTPAIVRRGGQRVASLVCYLNTPARGGSTTFPEARFEVAPVQGQAVFFSYDRPHPSTRTLHGGAPLIEGEKWVATKWLRESRFD